MDHCYLHFYSLIMHFFTTGDNNFFNISLNTLRGMYTKTFEIRYFRKDIKNIYSRMIILNSI